MIEELRTYIKNKNPQRTRCEQVLGTNTAVYRFAQFWNEDHENMDVIYAVLLHEWRGQRGFNSEQLDAFMEGLASWEMFFQKCAEEKETAKQKAEQEGHQLLGQ